MKILHISTYQKGGASMAAIRLHRALLNQGFDSKFLFLECRESDTFFKFAKRNFIQQFLWKLTKKFEIPLSLNEFKTRQHRMHFESFSFASSPYKTLHEHPLVRQSDVVNLHWVANFVDYKTFFPQVNKPLIWTLHDMHPFQGGFHYREDQDRNEPVLKEIDDQQFEIKKEAIETLRPDDMTVVAPSKWLLNLSSKSEMFGRFPHKHIPYSIDTSIFKVRHELRSGNKLRGEGNKVVILFVAEILGVYRKGFDMVAELLKDNAVNSKCVFVAVGKVKQSDQISGINYLGSVNSEEDMSVIYNSADLFIIPSREDNLPNTMIESLCCGTPVVGFGIGGLNESIKDYQNGMLADGLSMSQLKDALMTAISYLDKFDRNRISAAAHFRYSAPEQVKAYMSIYNKHLNVNGTEVSNVAH